MHHLLPVDLKDGLRLFHPVLDVAGKQSPGPALAFKDVPVSLDILAEVVGPLPIAGWRGGDVLVFGGEFFEVDQPRNVELPKSRMGT